MEGTAPQKVGDESVARLRTRLLPDAYVETRGRRFDRVLANALI